MTVRPESRRPGRPASLLGSDFQYRPWCNRYELQEFCSVVESSRARREVNSSLSPMAAQSLSRQAISVAAFSGTLASVTSVDVD